MNFIERFFIWRNQVAMDKAASKIYKNEGIDVRKSEKVETIKSTKEDLAKIKIKTKNLIDKLSDDLEFYEEVKVHIESGCKAAATGVVWEVSPYMTLPQVEKLIEDLSKSIKHFKIIYSELESQSVFELINSGLFSITDYLGNENAKTELQNQIDILNAYNSLNDKSYKELDELISKYDK